MKRRRRGCIAASTSILPLTATGILVSLRKVAILIFYPMVDFVATAFEIPTPVTYKIVLEYP